VLEVDDSFRCLVFASDGLWNVIDEMQSVDSVFETERRNDHNAKLGINMWRNPSRVLVETALDKWRSNGLRADNTTVVCVMLDPPNKRQNFRNFQESEDNTRRIFDYSTSEAYNLDCMSTLTRQPASYDLNLPTTSFQPPPLTYQTASHESAIVKACCRNNYQLASAHDRIPYHSSYEQHREMYENMALRPYPPLHYAYRPVPQPPLPSLHTNVYDHQGYVNSYKPPMERYNYLRPTPEEVAALHQQGVSEEDETMEFSDVEPAEVVKSSDDSIQIFEISSSNFSEGENSSDEAKKNNKENTEAKKKKIVAARFYATRQTDRKMRSGTVGVQKTLRSRRKIVKTIKKVAKSAEIQVKAKKLRSAKVEGEKVVIARSLRSTSQTNVMKKPATNVKHRRIK
jgi:hypothetical protein